VGYSRCGQNGPWFSSRREEEPIRSRIARPGRRSADIQGELGKLLGPGAVAPATTAYLTDATEHRGIKGRADAVVLPASTQEVAGAVAWCYEHEVPIVPRGGGTGFAAGAVPLDGGVVLGLERMTRVRAFEPLLWRICVEAGIRTAEVRRLARS
jgi:FAD/FMN-containing dehydrogenase